MSKKVRTVYQLYNFASCPGFSRNSDEKVQELAELAFTEQWHFNNFPESEKEILFKYIHHTFNRIYEEWQNSPGEEKNNKIFITNNDTQSCFNTGLYTNNYESIYGLFEKNRRTNAPQLWFFKGFKRKSELFFPSLPSRANYFNDISSLIFDFRLEIRIDCNHILEDNKNRLPKELQNIQNLEGAVVMTKKRIASNYRLAVPQFYNKKIQLLIPLYSSDPEDSKVKSVIPIQKINTEGNYYYFGKTCLTMDMAYNNARLIAKIDSDWLKPLRMTTRNVATG